MRKIVLLVLVASVGALLSPSSQLAAEEGETVFVIQIQEFPPSLDAHAQHDVLSHSVMDKVHRGLVQFDPATLEVLPSLAESWDILDEGRRLRFHLRDGIRFHNGREIQAQDFVFSFQRLLSMQPPARAAWILNPIQGAEAFARGDELFVEGLEAKDPRTLEITLDRPFAPFLQQLAMPQAVVVPWEEVQPREGSPNPLPVGAGPFRVVAADRSAGLIELRAFDDYYGGRPAIDRLEMQVVEEPESLLHGDAWKPFDLITSVAADYDGKIEGLDYHRWQTLSVTYLAINTRSADFPIGGTLRQALARILDSAALCRDALDGGCIPAVGMLPPAIPGSSTESRVPRHDAAEAARLLAEAGHPGGEGLPTYGLWHQDRPERRKAAEAVAGQLRAAGLSIELKPLPWARLLEEIRMGRPDLLLIGWAADYPDPYNFLFPLLASTECTSSNHPCYRNPAFDALLEKALAATDTQVRLDFYREAEALALKDLPVIPLYHDTQAILIRPEWHPLVLNPIGWGQIPVHGLSK